MSDNDSPTVGERGRQGHFDVIVLGAGVSGLVSASILLEQGASRVAVVDQYAHVGGNHIDCVHNGYTFDIGCFIFQDDSPLLVHLPELRPSYVPITPSWARLNPQGLVTQYPISIRDDLLAAGPVELLRIVSSAIRSRLVGRHPTNARDFARYWIGTRLLHRSGLENYIERFCGLPAERIDLRFAEKRMLWIAEQASLRSVLRRLLGPAAHPATNTQLARPREGFGRLYEPAVRRLEKDGATFVLGATATGLSRTGGTFRLQLGDRCLTADRLVSTIPIDRVRELRGERFEALPTVTLISLFYSFDGDRGFTASSLYNFSHTGAWKRLTVYSDFYGRCHGREFFAVEVIGGQVQESVELADRDFVDHVLANSLLAGDLRLEGSRLTRHAYPIYTEGAGERAERAMADLRAFGVESFGRQGGFAYQPTARVATLEAEQALRRG